MFRLAHRLADLLAVKEDCTLFQTSLWVSVLPIRAKQLPGPLAIGSVDPLLFGLQAQAHPGLCKDRLVGKGALLQFCWVGRQQPLDLWNNQPLKTRNQAESEALRSLSLPIKRK